MIPDIYIGRHDEVKKPEKELNLANETWHVLFPPYILFLNHDCVYMSIIYFASHSFDDHPM